jgi:hypothetical protein
MPHTIFQPIAKNLQKTSDCGAQWEAERFVSSYDFADGSNHHRTPVLLLEEKEGKRISGTCCRKWRDIDSRLKLKTRRLWDGSLHRETQKNPRPQSERILRKKRIFQGQGQIEMDW